MTIQPIDSPEKDFSLTSPTTSEKVNLYAESCEAPNSIKDHSISTFD